MRGTFAIVLLSLVGAAGCSDAAADIQATQHGKRLNLVSGEDPSNDVVPPSFAVPTNPNSLRPTSETTTPTPLYRDVAGVVLSDATTGVERLDQWLLSQDGTELRARVCPVKANGVEFAGCNPWSPAQKVSALGADGVTAIRSFSSYVFTDSSKNEQIAEVVYNMAGDERQERTCPAVTDGIGIDWKSCTEWQAHEESASDLGAPQQTAFEDEIVVPFLDSKGNAQFTQQLITPAGDAVWARSCTMTTGEIPGLAPGEAGNCAFSPPVPVSALGIHFDAVQGAGGYSYLDGNRQMYAQTVIAADGISAARRLCPMTGEGVAFEKCLGWDPVDLTDLTANGSTL